MDDILQYLINLSIFVPIIIILIVVSIRLSKSNLERIGIYKYVNVIERTSLNKDTDVFVLKIGDEGCVIMSSPSSIEKIKDLNIEEINNLEHKKEEIKKVNAFKFNIDKNNIKKLNLKKLNLNKLNLKEKKNGDTR